MHSRQTHPRLLPLAMSMASALLAGCAGLRCPRIDPSGERCLIWPQDEVVTPVAAVPSNVTAPPVGTDPAFPLSPVTAAPVAAAPAVIPAAAAYPPVAGDTLSITPARVLAPVGSEVVLKASICTTEGYTLADQKIEWMLGRNGVGQFVEVGGMGLLHPPLLPWYQGKKVDNYLANGYTANGPLCITRGTADPTDDININRGDAWISVTSPNEGTSHVTAYTPAIQSWDQRKSAATIYWVDVQWTFPPPTVASSGRGETLTTVVNRQTDGTPIVGWIVSYQVVGGTAQEVATGADGRASVQVAPTDTGAASSQIDLQLIRPAGYGGSDAPRLVIGSSSTIITWGGDSYLPPSSAQPLPTTPPVAGPITGGPIQPGPVTPQPQLPAGRPRLELDVQGPSQVQVGGQATFRVTIRNVGDGPATGVQLEDRFDPGLVFPLDPSTQRIENRAIGAVPAGETRSLDIELQVSKAGQLCQQVTVSHAEGDLVSRPLCITGIAAPPQREGQLEANIEGPATAVQGETVVFKIKVKNAGQTALVNITIREEYPTAILQPMPVDRSVQVVNGTITRQISRLEIGQSREFEVPCLCRQATRAVAVLRASAETDPPTRTLPTADEHEIEILPPRGQPPAGTGPAAPGATASPLSVRVSFVNPPVRVNARATTEIVVKNNSSIAERDVGVRVAFPPQLTPDVATAEGPQNATVRLNEGMVQFSPLATLAPGETVLYRIHMNPTQVGIVPVTAQVISRNVRQPVQHTENLEIIGNRL